MLIELFVPPTVADEDRARYSRQISNWTYLSTYLSMAKPDHIVLGKLIRIELDGRNRRDIIDRLASRLTSSMRDILKAEVADVHERVASRKVSI